MKSPGQSPGHFKILSEIPVVDSSHLFHRAAAGGIHLIYHFFFVDYLMTTQCPELLSRRTMAVLAQCI